MKGNFHVRFLGEKGGVIPLTYPTNYKFKKFLSQKFEVGKLVPHTVSKKLTWNLQQIRDTAILFEQNII